MAGDLTKEDRDMFNQLLIVDVVRGHHSTGVASVTASKHISLFKRAMNPVDLMQHKQYDKAVAWDSQVLIGHNRYATVGAVNNRTAHPFEFDGIVGAHNGTLTGWKLDLEDSDLFDVDSECLIWNLASQGWDETIKNMRGAAALSVYHKDTHSLCLYRNAQRPLYFTYNVGKTAVYWASESWMLRNIGARAGVKLHKDIMSLKENTLVSWRLPSTKASPIPDPHVRRMEVAYEKKHIPLSSPVHSRAAAASQKTATGSDTSRQSGGSSSCTSARKVLEGVSIGDRINFVPCSLETSKASGQTYLAGLLSDDPWIEVRVYAGIEYIKGVIDDERELEGIVSSVGTGDGTDSYVVCQAQSIRGGTYLLGKPDDDAGDDDEVVETLLAPGPGGRLIDKATFDDLAKHGCGECSCIIDFEEDYEWFGGYPICMDCATMDNW